MLDELDKAEKEPFELIAGQPLKPVKPDRKATLIAKLGDKAKKAFMITLEGLSKSAIYLSNVVKNSGLILTSSIPGSINKTLWEEEVEAAARASPVTNIEGFFKEQAYEQQKSELEISGNTPFKHGLLKLKQVEARSFEDLGSIRDYVAKYALCNAIGSESLPEGLSSQRISIINPCGGFYRQYANQFDAHLNYMGYRVNKKSREIKNLIAAKAGHRHYSICHCIQDGKACPHAEQFKPTIVMSLFGDQCLDEELICHYLHRGTTIIAVTYLFNPLLKEGSYGQGRWQEATWHREKGFLFFDNLREVYVQTEVFSKFFYTSTIAGVNFTANKVVEIDLGSFKCVGIVIRPLLSSINARDLSDLSFGGSLEELMAFKEAQHKGDDEIAIMEADLSIAGCQNLISRDGAIVACGRSKTNPLISFKKALLEDGKELSNEWEFELVRNIKGRIHFSKFKRHDMNFLKCLVGLEKSRYGKALLYEYFANHGFNSVDVSFSISLPEYNGLLSDLLIFEKIDVEAVRYIIGTTLTGSLKECSDLSVPLLLMESLIRDATKAKSAVKALANGPIMDEATDISAIPEEESIAEEIKQRILPSNEINGPVGSVIAAIDQPSVTEEIWRSLDRLQNGNNCLAVTLMYLILEHCEADEETVSMCLNSDPYEVLEGLLDEAEVPNKSHLLGLAGLKQPNPDDALEAIYSINPKQRILFVADKGLRVSGECGSTIALSAGHVEFYYPGLSRGEPLIA
jgi:hypothetical protein